MKIERISTKALIESSKWPIGNLQPPLNGFVDSLVVDYVERSACAQAFTRYKRANPGFEYTSKREGMNYRFWRTA